MGANSPDQHLLITKTLPAILALAFVYAACGKLALLRAVPPGYGTIFFPSAGIVLATIVTGGGRLLRGLFWAPLPSTCSRTWHCRPSHGRHRCRLLPSLPPAPCCKPGAGARVLQRWLSPALDTGRSVVLFCWQRHSSACSAPALRSLATLFSQQQITSNTTFSRVARSYLVQRPELQAMFWVPRVALSKQQAFEQWARLHVAGDYAIRRIHPDRQPATHASRQDLYPVA